MSRALNPNVMPKSVEAAGKALRSDSLNHPLPLSTQSPRQIYQPIARHIISPRTQAHRLEQMEKVRVIQPREAPFTAPRSKVNYRTAQGLVIQDAKAEGPKVQGRKRPQRRGKQPLLDYHSVPQKTRNAKKSTPNLLTPPVVGGRAIDRRDQIPRKWGQAQHLQTQTKQAGINHSSYQRKTQKEIVQRKKQNENESCRKQAMAKKKQLDDMGHPKVEACGEKCMGGQTFDSNHSAVLAIKTIWRPRSWRDEQEDAEWPLPIEFEMEGCDRQKNGYGRFLPVPRSNEFEWRLATKEWLADPKRTRNPIWKGEGPVPRHERRFAWVRSQMDAVVGTGLCVDDLLLFDRAEEMCWEDPAEIIGKKLWEEIECEECEGLKEKSKEDGEVSKEEETMRLRNWLLEETEEEMDKAGRYSLQKLKLGCAR